jgi:hypothetical protein
MERSRSTTQKQRRRFDALRRTLRRQEGGARPVDVTLASLTATFKETGITVADTPFEFLNDATWFEKETAAKNYMTLIGKQDDFFSLSLAHIKSQLAITDATTDTDIMTKISAAETPASSLVKIFKDCFNLVCLADLGKLDAEDGCDSTRYSKPYYNLNRNKIALYSQVKRATATTVSEPIDRYNLATILLHPSLLSNITVSSIANILKTLGSDIATQNLIGTADVKDTLSFVFLVEKYTSYIFSSAYSLTSDKPRDALYSWGCAESSEDYWNRFFITFLLAVKGKKMEYTGLKQGIDSGAARTSQKSQTYGETTTAEAFGEITAVVFNNREAATNQILAKFVAEAFAPQALPTGGVATRGAKAQLPPTLERSDMTGMLPVNTWDQELAPGVTFRKLLFRLSVPELHYLLHLVTAFKELQATVATDVPETKEDN